MNAIVKSEARVPFRDLEVPDVTKYGNIGVMAQGSLDNVVGAFLSTTMAYAGLACAAATSSSGAPLVNVGAGLFFRSGMGYALRDTAAIDLSRFVAQVPDAAKTLSVLIVVDGQEADVLGDETFLDQNRQPSDPNAYWPTVDLNAPLMTVRSVIPSPAGGTADVQPQDPAYNTSILLPIARVIVNNAGIVSVTQMTDGRITSLDTIAPIIASVANQIAGFQGIIAGLLASAASTALALASLRADFNAAIADLQRQINALTTRAVSSPTATFRGQDNFQDLSQSNPAASGYSAVVASGLRFAVTKNDLPFGLALAQNSGIQQNLGSLLTPSYAVSSSPVSSVAPWGGQPYYTGYAYLRFPTAITTQTFNRAFGRVRTRLGKSLKAGSAAQVLASGDPSQLFSLAPFTYDPTWGDWTKFGPTINHGDGFWQDQTSIGDWAPIASVGAIAGLGGFSQPVVPSASMMAMGLKVPVVDNPSSPKSSLRLIVCEDVNGRPDFSKVYADVQSTETDQQTIHGNGYTVVAATQNFQFPFPIFMMGGRRYHFCIFSQNTSAGWMQTVTYGDGTAGPGGGPQIQTANTHPALRYDYLAYNGTDWVAAAPTTGIMLSVDVAAFSTTTTRIPLQSLTLQNGIDLIDILTVAVVPDGCSIGFEAFINGAYTKLSPGNAAAILGQLPTNVPINLVISGTTTCQPIIDLLASAMRASRANNNLDHVSSHQVPSGPVTKIHKTITVDQWNGAVQTLTANLRTGTGFATITAPDAAPADVTNLDGSLSRTWIWTLSAAVSSFDMELIGATTDTTQTFVGRQSVWDAG